LDRILSGIDAQTQEHVLKMFEAIKGRKPTAEELAQLRGKIPVAKDAKPS
jgi:response regulator of citrate/malate metabolism